MCLGRRHYDVDCHRCRVCLDCFDEVLCWFNDLGESTLGPLLWNSSDLYFELNLTAFQTIVIGINLLLMGLTYVCYAKYEAFSANPGKGSLEAPGTWMTLLVVAGILAALVLCFTLFMCKRIILGEFQVLKEKSTYFSHKNDWRGNKCHR